MRVERHSLKIGLDAANITVGRMENEAETIKQQLKRQEDIEDEDVYTSNSGNSSIANTRLHTFKTTSRLSTFLKLREDELARKTDEAKDLASQLYDYNKTIAILEERLRDLNFNLHQKNTELASTKTMAAVRSDGQDREVAELKEKVCLNYWPLSGIKTIKR